MSMTKQEMIDYSVAWLKRVTDLILAVPKRTAVFSTDTNPKGMQFYAGMPMSIFNLATTAAEATTLQAGTVDYLDTRTSTYWTKASGSWVSTPYVGGRAFLRKYTLVLGRNNGKVFLHGEPGALHAVDTTIPTP